MTTIPSALRLSDHGAEAVILALHERRWDLDFAEMPTGGVRLTVRPRVIDGVRLHADQFYDSRVAVVDGTKIVPSGRDGWQRAFPAQATRWAVFCGVRYEAYEQLRRTGQLEREAVQQWDYPTQAILDATDVWPSGPTFERPAIVLRLRAGGDGGVKATAVTDVYVGRPYRIKAGAVELTRASARDPWLEGNRESPSAWLVWKRMNLGPVSLDVRHAYRLGFCVTCGTVRRECFDLQEAGPRGGCSHTPGWRERCGDGGGGGAFSAEDKAGAAAAFAAVEGKKGFLQPIAAPEGVSKEALSDAVALVASEPPNPTPEQKVPAKDILDTMGGNASAQFAELITKANEARPVMQAITTDVEEALRDVVEDVGILEGVKGLDRSVKKAVGKDTGDARTIRDAVRSSVAVDKVENLVDAMTAVHKAVTKHGGEILTTDDKFAKPLPSGYRDFSLNVKMPNGVIGEIQINLGSMVEAKEGSGHKMYEAARSIQERWTHRAPTPEEKAEVQRLDTAMSDLYAEAWRKGGGQ